MEYTKSQLREMAPEHLMNLVAEMREDLRSLKFKAAQNELKTVHKIGKLKKLIAQILTVYSQKVKDSK